MDAQNDNTKKLSEDELGSVTGGAAVAKATMMRMTCKSCGKAFFADVTKDEVKCKHCGAPKKLEG